MFQTIFSIVVEYATQIAAGLTALTVIVLRGRPIVLSLSAIYRIPAQIRDILTELKPNGGGSMRDAVDDTRARLCRVERQGLYNTELIWMEHDASDTPIFWTDEAGEVERVNHAYRKQTGHAYEDLRGRRWVSLIRGDFVEYVMETWGHILSDKRPGALVFPNSDGKWLQVEVKPISLDDTVTGYIGTTRIITEAEGMAHHG